jgi:hypothetical protein
MIYFDSNMSKSTNTIVYFDWKTVIYISFCRKCRAQFMLPMEKSVTLTGACANEMLEFGDNSCSLLISPAQLMQTLIQVLLMESAGTCRYNGREG